MYILWKIYLQKVYETQQIGRMTVVEEESLDIKMDAFAPKTVQVTMELSAAKLDPGFWDPAEDNDKHWDSEQRHFVKVCTMFHSFRRPCRE